MTKTYMDTRPINNYIEEEVNSCRSSHDHLSVDVKDKEG